MKVWSLKPEGILYNMPFLVPLENFPHTFTNSLDKSKKVRKKRKGRYLKELTRLISHIPNVVGGMICLFAQKSWGQNVESTLFQMMRVHKTGAKAPHIPLGKKTQPTMWCFVRKGRNASLGKCRFTREEVVHSPISKSRAETFRKLGTQRYHLEFWVVGTVLD